MLFEDILIDMNKLGVSTSKPQGFQTYAKANNLSANTAASISIDALKKLPKTLKQANTMVLRLGSRPRDNQTYFSLVRTIDIRNFFFDDELLFGRLKPSYFYQMFRFAVYSLSSYYLKLLKLLL